MQAWPWDSAERDWFDQGSGYLHTQLIQFAGMALGLCSGAFAYHLNYPRCVSGVCGAGERAHWRNAVVAECTLACNIGVMLWPLSTHSYPPSNSPPTHALYKHTQSPGRLLRPAAQPAAWQERWQRRGRASGRGAGSATAGGQRLTAAAHSEAKSGDPGGRGLRRRGRAGWRLAAARQGRLAAPQLRPCVLYVLHIAGCLAARFTAVHSQAPPWEHVTCASPAWVSGQRRPANYRSLDCDAMRRCAALPRPRDSAERGRRRKNLGG